MYKLIRTVSLGLLIGFSLVLFACVSTRKVESDQAEASVNILPADWDPKAEADKVLGRLTGVCLPRVKGAHDSDFIIRQGKAYIVYMANDVQSSENPRWPYIYNAMSVVDLETRHLDTVIVYAASERAYKNDTLPAGACFVPRILQLDQNRLRCFFASENPGLRESQTWYIDFDIPALTFDNKIFKARLLSSEGLTWLQPGHFYHHAVSKGFGGKQTDYGLYQIDSFKEFGGRIYAVLNNFPAGQNALSFLHEDRATFEIMGDFNEPDSMMLTESSVNRLPDGSWLAICRQRTGDQNYTFSSSMDGVNWTVNQYRDPVWIGTASKPSFDCFNGIYYLGWQESTRINGVPRSVFNIEVSTDCKSWERKYRFETEKSFQYPVFREQDGTVYLTVTQGDHSPDRKEYIAFGRLE